MTKPGKLPPMNLSDSLVVWYKLIVKIPTYQKNVTVLVKVRDFIIMYTNHCRNQIVCTGR